MENEPTPKLYTELFRTNGNTGKGTFMYNPIGHTDNHSPNGLSGIYDIHTWACFRDLEVRKLIFKDDKRFKPF